MLTDAELRSLAEAAVAAPSADNQHLFELHRAGDDLVLRGDARYVGAPFHKKVLAWISFGAVAENLAVRAARLGYRAAIEPADGGEPALIATIRIVRAGSASAPLDAAIASRQTNRTVRFRGPRLPSDELTSLQSAAGDIDGVTLNFYDQGPERARLLDLVRIAETERFNTRSMHADLFDAVRFDVGWNADADVGLPPGGLGIEPGMRNAFALLRHWPLMDALRRLGVHRMLGRRAGWLPCRLAPHIGVFYTRLPHPRGTFSAGRALERVWLEAERRGLAFQPFAAAPLFALADYRDVPEATGERLRRGWRALSPDRPVMVFRLGRAPRPPFRTSRPAPDRFVGGPVLPPMSNAFTAAPTDGATGEMRRGAV
jgi:hypothetical protein